MKKLLLAGAVSLTSMSGYAATCSDYDSGDGLGGYITTSWHHSGHDSPSVSARQQFALNACRASLNGVKADCERKDYVFRYRYVEAAKEWGGWSKTSRTWDNKRTWKGGGNIKCRFRYKKSYDGWD